MNIDGKRNSRIVEMRKSGRSYRELSRLFDISTERVRQIVLRFEFTVKRKERSLELLKEIRSTNDIDKRWSKDVILDGLMFPRRAISCLEQFLNTQNMTGLSLRDLMDFVIPRQDTVPSDPWEAMPALEYANVGYKTYGSMVRCLSEPDLGSCFNAEWAKRKEELRRYFRRTTRYSPAWLE